MYKLLIITLFVFSVLQNVKAQFSRQDSLRGSITPERAWWDVLKYDITVTPDFASKSIIGKNIITLKAIEEGDVMQIDLQQPMIISSIVCGNKKLDYRREGNAFMVFLPRKIKKGKLITLEVDFKGKPKEASNPPWDGGWIWKKDANGQPWMSVACQILGASVWYPCKDHQSDEPDSATLTIIVPDNLVGIGNGRLRKSFITENGLRAYQWAVTSPINNYNIVPYIGNYIHWSEQYNGENGLLDLDFWVLKENEKKGKAQFQQVPPMIKCFEHWFGPYPFYEDGYKLIEAPHLGMEHQSAIAYGNKFANGYLGSDLSGSGWGKKWDYIIIHESGHEWFGNNITAKDVADMWLQEAFTTYSETLFTECKFGKKAADEYCRGQRKNIDNEKTIIGSYGIHKEGSGDMYFKGANLVHTIRHIIDDDERFRRMLREMNNQFYHQTVTTEQIENFISSASGRNLSKVFDQYLRTVKIPLFEYQQDNNKIRYRWANCVEGFDMPIKVTIDKDHWLYPTSEWQELDIKNAPSIKPNPNFYVDSKRK